MKKFFQQEKIVITGLILILVVLAFYDVVFLSKTFKVATANPQALITGVYGQEKNRPDFFPVHSTTTSLMEEPMFEFIRKWLQKGVFPFWNPHQGCGYPLISMMHLGFFWPLNWIMFFLPNTVGWDIVILARFFLSGIFTYWFMRSLRFTKIPSLTAAIIFMLSGPMVLLQYSFANVDILTPLLLIAFERLLRRPNLQSACFTSLAIAATIIAGHPEHIVLVNAFGVLYFLFRSLSARNFPCRLKSLYLLGLSFVLAGGLSSAALFPFLRDWKDVFWHTHPDTMGLHVGGAKYIRAALLTVINPHFFQKYPVTLDFVRQTFWGHFGIIPLGLVFISLFSKQRKGLNWFFAFLFFAIFAKTYIKLPVINWIGYLPVFKHIRFSLHTGHLFTFAGSIAAGMGMRMALNIKRKIFFKSATYTSFILLWLTGSLYFYRQAEHFPQSVKAGLLTAGLLAVFLLCVFLKEKQFLKLRLLAPLFIFLIFFELFLYIPRANIKRFDSFPDVPYIENIKKTPLRQRSYGIFWSLYPNTATPYLIDDLGINQGLMTKRFVEFVNHYLVKDYFTQDFQRSAFFVIPATFLPESRPFMDLLNVRFTIAPQQIQEFYPIAKNPGFLQPIYNKEVVIYNHATAFPRVFIVHKVLPAANQEDALKKTEAIKNNFAAIAVIEGDIPQQAMALLKNGPVKDRSFARIQSYTPNEVVVAAFMENPGFLILGDTFHPDWRAIVDGRNVKIYPADYLLRGVYLPAGAHIVEFRFIPVAYYFGVCLSLVSLSILGILFFYDRLKSGSR